MEGVGDLGLAFTGQVGFLEAQIGEGGDQGQIRTWTAGEGPE